MKKLISLVMILMLLVGMTTISKATITENVANIGVILSKEEVKVNENITVTVNWKDEMEAVDLMLKFDKDKLQFVSSSVGSDFVNAKNGSVQVSWISLNGKGINSIDYTFKAKKSGSVKFVTSEAVFADGNVKSPESYKYGVKTLKITDKANSGSNSTTNSKDKTTNNKGQKPTEYLQAGVNVVEYVATFATIIIAVSLLSAVIIKNRKK